MTCGSAEVLPRRCMGIFRSRRPRRTEMRQAWVLIAALACASADPCFAQDVPREAALNAGAPIVVAPDWGSAIRKSQTRLTLQVVVNPPLRRGSVIHDAAWQSLAQLDAVDARFAMWYPYPRLAVAEISPPTKNSTSWDFSAMDPLIADFFNATKKRPTVLTLSTIPQWMFKTSTPVAVPSDPDQAVWDYDQGSRLRDDSMEEISTYYERVACWYIRGGFVDESSAGGITPAIITRLDIGRYSMSPNMNMR